MPHAILYTRARASIWMFATSIIHHWSGVRIRLRIRMNAHPIPLFLHENMHCLLKCNLIVDEECIQLKLLCWVPTTCYMMPAVQSQQLFKLACISLSPIAVAIRPSITRSIVFSKEQLDSIHFSNVQNLPLWRSRCGSRIQQSWASIHTGNPIPNHPVRTASPTPVYSSKKSCTKSVTMRQLAGLTPICSSKKSCTKNVTQ